MFTVIVLTKAMGFNVLSAPDREKATEIGVTASATPGNLVSIYNPFGGLIWRLEGRDPAPVATDDIPVPQGAPRYKITTGPQFDFVCKHGDMTQTIKLAEALKARHGKEYDVWTLSGGEERMTYSTGYRVSIDPIGTYYASDGTLMNANGTRSIFDDVDK
jgi:hypothetical protein